MLEHLSKRFAGKLICAGIISEADADVYVYGFFQGMMLLLNVIVGHIVSTASSLHVVKCSIHTNSDQRWWSSCRQSLSMLYQFYHHDCDFACGN